MTMPSISSLAWHPLGMIFFKAHSCQFSLFPNPPSPSPTLLSYGHSSPCSGESGSMSPWARTRPQKRSTGLSLPHLYTLSGSSMRSQLQTVMSTRPKCGWKRPYKTLRRAISGFIPSATTIFPCSGRGGFSSGSPSLHPQLQENLAAGSFPSTVLSEHLSMKSQSSPFSSP